MFTTPTGRTIYRFLEIFVIGGVIALYKSPEAMSLVTPGSVALVAALLKAIREAKA